MELQELINLINIRQYVSNSLGNPTLDRSAISELNGILLLLDKKIVGMIRGAEFKDYIGFANVKQAIVEAAKIANIKSGIRNS